MPLSNFDGDESELLDCVFRFMKETKESDEIKNLIKDAVRRNLSKESGRSKEEVLLSTQPQFAPSVLPKKVMPEEKKAEELLSKTKPTASDYQNSNVSYKKKSERALLKGYTCADCDPYVESCNLPKKNLQEVVQKSSKHRATIIPPKNSPKGM